MHLIPIEDNCTVTSKYFTLPLKISGSFTKEQEIKFSAEISIAKLSPSIWSNTSFRNKILFPNEHTFEEISSELAKIENIPLDHLQSVINHLKEPTRVSTSLPKSVLSVIIVAVVISVLSICLGLLVVGLIVYYKYCGNSKQLSLIKFRKRQSDNVVDKDPRAPEPEHTSLVIEA